MDGAASAVELSVSMAGILCLWSGVMEIMNVCGLSAGLARAFRPILRRLMPQASRDEKTLAALSANVSRQSAGTGQRRHAPRDPGGPADGPWLQRHRQRRAVPAGGAEYRFHPAAARHHRLRPQRQWSPVSLRHPAGSVAGLGPVGGGWRSDGQIPGRRGEVRR